MIYKSILTAIVLLSLVGCSRSPEGKYVLEGNDKIYLELKPIDSKSGTVVDSGVRTGTYTIRGELDTIAMTQKSGEWIGLGYFRGSEIVLTDYLGVKKEHRFVKTE